MGSIRWLLLAIVNADVLQLKVDDDLAVQARAEFAKFDQQIAPADAVLDWAERSLARQPSANAYQIVAASLAHLGRIEEARDALAELTRLRPGISPAAIRHYYAVADPGHADRLIEGLRLAGWVPPEDDRRIYPQM